MKKAPTRERLKILLKEKQEELQTAPEKKAFHGTGHADYPQSHRFV